MKNRSKTYWEKRADLRMTSYHKGSDEAISKINLAYNKAIKDINKDIDKIFYKYKTDGDLSTLEAKDLLNSKISKKELKSIKGRIKHINDEEMKKYMLSQLNAGAYKARITRLEALKESIYTNTKKVADVELAESTKLYTNNINKAYYNNVFDIQKGLGVGFNVAQMPVSTIQEILKNNWSGKHYSERVWNNTDVLAEKLQEVIISGLMSGKSSRRMAKELSDLTDYGKFAAERLIRTETTYVTNMAEIEGYKEAGIDKYIFIATLDLRTSKKCRDMDRKVIDVIDVKVGINLPPLHPYCRSATRAYLGEDTLKGIQRRSRDPETGKTYLVPGDMNYNDWYQKYVVDKYGPQKAEIFEKMINNKASDKKQFNNYKEVLGKDAPKSFDKFRDLKYNNTKEYEDLKGYYGYKKSNPESDKTYYKINKDIKKLIDNGIVKDGIGVALPPVVKEFTDINKHALKRMGERGISEENSKDFINKARVMFIQGNDKNKFAFYSNEGMSVVIEKEKRLITTLGKHDYDKAVEKMMEVFDKYGI